LPDKYECMKKSCYVLIIIAGWYLSAFATPQDTNRKIKRNATESIFQQLMDEENEDFPVIPVVRPGHDSIPVLIQMVSDTIAVVPDTNTLLEYIQQYDIRKHIVYPRPPRKFNPNEVLDYPDMSPLFMPLVFNAQKRNYRLYHKDVEDFDIMLKAKSLDSLRTVFQSVRFIGNLAQNILQNAEIEQIGQIEYDQKTLPQPEKLVYQLDSKRPPTWVKPTMPISMAKPDTKMLPKAEFSPWSKLGYSKFQLTQTYVSPNWSKGGESNMAGLVTLYLQADYSESKDLVFENSVDIKIGLNTVTSDTLRNLNVSTDQLKAVSKLGLRMYNDWYYSLSGEFTTQFLNNYKTNTWTMTSSFLSPAKLFIGLGVDYKKVNKKKGYNLSVLVTPLTMKFNYLYDNENFTPSSYGIEEGRHFGKELGSKISANLTWTFSEQVKWNSKFYYYTDFTYVDTDWENTLDLMLNNYFTTSIYVHLKLDDRLEREPGESLLQVQELLSFGMMYRW
jgi:hypothetical protein